MQICLCENEVLWGTTWHYLGIERCQQYSPSSFFFLQRDMSILKKKKKKSLCQCSNKNKIQEKKKSFFLYKSISKGPADRLSHFALPSGHLPVFMDLQLINLTAEGFWDSMAVLLLSFISVCLDWSIHTTVRKGQEPACNSGCHVLIPVLTGVAKKI